MPRAENLVYHAASMPACLAIPAGFRKLRCGERLRPGDWWLDTYVSEWKWRQVTSAVHTWHIGSHERYIRRRRER